MKQEELIYWLRDCNSEGVSDSDMAEQIIKWNNDAVSKTKGVIKQTLLPTLKARFVSPAIGDILMRIDNAEVEP